VSGSGSGDGARTAAAVLADRLRQLGVTRIYGAPLADLAHVGVDDPDLAVLLADADGRLGAPDGGGRLGAALLAGGVLHLSSRPGGTAPLQSVGSVEEVLDVLVDPPGLTVPGTLAVHLDLDLDEPVPPQVAPAAERERRPVLILEPSLGSLRMLALVGPGVIRARAVEGVRSFTRTAGAPVLATWGARGVEHWDSPYSAGVGGVQANDLALGGLRDAEVVLTTGLDPDEIPAGALDGLVVQDVAPAQLGVLCHRWPTRSEPPRDRNDVRAALAGVLTPLYEDDSSPLSPARAALHLSGALPDRGLAVADPGPAGFWVARAFPSSIPGSSVVPATREEGFAAAAALVAGVEGRPALAVTDVAGLGPVTAAVGDLARSLRVPLRLQVWADDGPRTSPAEHVALLADHLGDPGVRVDRVGVRLEVPEELVELAGPPVPVFGDRDAGR
jgi:hypothetical protein